ncbi:MAG: ferrochelatase [Coleofasciculaceae cyanobacterium RL_1_1]|nr:ferrochelatase [Coleofasciculaceae cyanobacterium RL_1_1]
MTVTDARNFVNENKADESRVAVLLMGYGEVESYEDFANYNEQALNLLTAKFAPVPNWIYPPLAKLLAMFDMHEWGHQHNNFISPHNAIFERQRAGIEDQLRQTWGDRVTVFKAFNFCAPFLPEQVIAEINEQGFDRLLIYPLLVVDSIFTSGIALEQVNDALEKVLKNVSADGEEPAPLLRGTRYIPSFYDRAEYIDLLARIVIEKVEGELIRDFLPSQIGIVLMNHGCPFKAKGFTSGIDESQALYEAVRQRIINRYPLVSVGWLNHDTPLIEWTQPDVDTAASNLIQLGARAIVMMPIGFATENHETLLDVHHIIHHLEHKHPNVRYEQMACVNDREEFLQIAASWANEHIASLLNVGVPEVTLSIAPSSETKQAEPVHTGHTHHHGHVHDHGNGQVHSHA